MYYLSEFTEERAKAVCGWKYENEYSVYNFPAWERIQELHFDITDAEVRKNQYCAVVDETGTLCGYFLFRPNQNAVMLGLGVHPAYCGKGYGAELMKLILEEFRSRYPGRELELEVRGFNQRAIRCYSHAGFQKISEYFKETPIGADTYLRMRLTR